MLRVLHLKVLKIDRDVAHVAMVFQLYVSNVSSVLDVHILQSFHLDVAKIDWGVA
jgi:hypothetical protein